MNHILSEQLRPVTLDKSGKTFQGTESITIISPANVTTGPFTGTLQGVRMHAEAP